MHKLLTPSAVLVLFKSTGWTLHILSARPLCGITKPPTPSCMCNTQSVCWEPNIPAGQIYGTCVDCLHNAHRADLTLTRGIGLVPNRLSAPQTLKYGALKGFCYACRDFHCLDIQQNNTVRINPLGWAKLGLLVVAVVVCKTALLCHSDSS